ncbi:DinB superfamily protein [Phycisphaerae bacterium RAS1]|nr:DinB superfamily protein [Phycisphaerae bacterium RAS1]
MSDPLKTLLAGQFNAALSTLNLCIERCPEAAWNAPVANLKFCQVALHTLIFADLYLGRDDELAFRRQPFHLAHADFFRDYEELEDRPQQLLYDRPTIQLYVRHCRSKLAEVIAAETAESLAAPCGLPRRTFSRAELYVYNTRHIQHHAAQLSLRLRLDFGVDIPWVSLGWREA